MANLNSSIINGFLRVIGNMKVKSLEIEENTLVPNLNADLLDGKQGSEYASSTDVSALSTRMTSAENTISSHTSSISTLNSTTSTLSTNLSNLSSQVSTNSTNIGTNTSEISSIKTRLTSDESAISNNTSRIDQILAGTAEIPTIENADYATNAGKLGNQLPSYYATQSDLGNYLALTGGTVDGLVKILGTAADNSLMVRGIRGSNATGTQADALYLNYGNQQPVYINGTNVVYHSGNIPSGTTGQAGIVQLNDTHTSTSTTLAATANAVKGVYDTLNTALGNHTSDTDVHLSSADRAILTKANKFKGYYETETALNTAHPTGEAGDYAIVNETDTLWIWDADKAGGAGWKDGAGLGSVISVNNMTGEVVITKTNLGLGNVDNTSDANKPVSTAQQAALDLKVNKAGDTMTGELDLNVSTSNGQLRLRSGSGNDTYGALIKNSGTQTLFLLTNVGSAASGNYNSLRPLYIDNSTGLVHMDNKIVSGDDTDSTSTSTGSLQVVGGVGVAKNIYTGLDINTRDVVIRGSNTANSTRRISSDAANDIYFSIGGAARTVMIDDIVRPATAKSGLMDLGTSSVKWRNIYLSNNVDAAGSVIAGTELKTSTGKVNYKDKAYIQYNATNESLEFVFE